jgi:hypothetical protein
MYPIQDPLAALTHHRQLIAQRQQDRTTRARRRQARARRQLRRADTADHRAVGFAERLV